MKYFLILFCFLFLSCIKSKVCYYSVKVTYTDNTKELLTLTSNKTIRELRPYLYNGNLRIKEETHRSYVKKIEILTTVCEE